jgi:hypothetical protein
VADEAWLKEYGEDSQKMKTFNLRLAQKKLASKLNETERLRTVSQIPLSKSTLEELGSGSTRLCDWPYWHRTLVNVFRLLESEKRAVMQIV